MKTSFLLITSRYEVWGWFYSYSSAVDRGQWISPSGYTIVDFSNIPDWNTRDAEIDASLGAP